MLNPSASEIKEQKDKIFQFPEVRVVEASAGSGRNILPRQTLQFRFFFMGVVRPEKLLRH